MAYEQSSLAKISDTQKIIKNKFIKAYSNRVDHENDVNESLKPLSSINRTSTKKLNKSSTVTSFAFVFKNSTIHRQAEMSIIDATLK